jgi:hypothetical protein
MDTPITDIYDWLMLLDYTVLLAAVACGAVVLMTLNADDNSF